MNSSKQEVGHARITAKQSGLWLGMNWRRLLLVVAAMSFANTAVGQTDRGYFSEIDELRHRIEELECRNEELSQGANEQFTESLPPLDGDDLLSTPENISPHRVDESMRQRLTNLEAQFDSIRANLELGVLAPGRLRSTDIAPIVKLGTAPTYPNVKVTGFFQLDAGYFNQSGGNLEQYGSIQNDLGFRRTRLAAVGDVAENTSYMLEMDFAFPGRPSFMDIWLDVHEIVLLGNVRVGQWRQPFGLDNLTSVRELMFLERPLAFGMAPFRQTGIGFHDTNEDASLTWAASVYGADTDAWGNVYGNKGLGTAVRFTGLPVYEDEGRRVLHLGFDHSFTVPGRAGIAYRNTPEYGGPFGSSSSQSVPGGTTGGGNSGDVPFFYNTGALFFDTSHLLNAEIAGVYNRVHWQSEVTYNVVDFQGSTAVIPAYYAQAAFLLTRETRPYNKIAGVLGRIKPLRPFGERGGVGAWELAIRYSYINTNPIVPYQSSLLAAAQPAGPPIPWGGALNNITFGLNWYLNTYSKFQLNYIVANSNRDGTSNSADIIALRAQLDF